ncbi:MAG TPA: ATP-binding protein [Bacteroidales bacterium]|nr:MAG: 2-ketoisovalerate ferredoxin oxidoreductase subunit delta [Bacteroidetes bacterium ADurb.Bin041]HNV50913.1 ATP-binding protein [Bacteroidales bacterium]HPW43954.1 ATP-binding protein [Bacteroidales bacterium]
MKVAIASGKGGTGKTLLSVHLFDNLIQSGEQVVLVDCDAEEPNDMIFFDGKLIDEAEVLQQTPIIDTDKCTFCGKCHEYCNYNAIFYLPPASMIHVIDELCHGCGACNVACKFGAITERPLSLGVVRNYQIRPNARIVESRIKVGVMTPVPLIKAGLKQIKNEPFVLLDSPPGTSCPFIHTILDADYVILITEPTPFGLSDLKQSVETLKTVGKAYGVIINKAGIGDSNIYDYLKNENIELLMEIPFDKEIAYHYSKGELLTEYNPKLQSDLNNLLNNIHKKYGTSNN